MIIVVGCMLVPSSNVSAAILNVSQSISDVQTLVSKGGVFELGFFSPGKSKYRYLGIWYKNISIDRVVWVANPESPINGSGGILTLTSSGDLELRQNDSIVWSAIYETRAQNPVAELLDSGNLVIRNEEETNPEAYLWQSFDYPSDTLLPGMKLGWNLRTGLERKIRAWTSPDNPFPGNVSWGLMLYSYPEFYVMEGERKIYRTGPWNGLQFSGSSKRNMNPSFEFNYVSKNDPMYMSNKIEMFYSYTLKNSSVIARYKITHDGFRMSVWIEEDPPKWLIFSVNPRDLCDLYSNCGAYGSCVTTEAPMCQCLEGFRPISTQEWDEMDWSHGCVRDKPLSCQNKNEDWFIKLENLKVPDTTNTFLDENIDLVECSVKCLSNCSCMAYTNSDIRGAGRGCVLWFGDLFDISKFGNEGGQDLYIRMAPREYEHGHNQSVKIIIVTTISAIATGLLFCSFLIYRVRRNIADKSMTKDNNEIQLKDLDLPLFDLLTVTTATNNFSLNNKIGQGGFGPVYKGKLVDGRIIAVKKLSSSSGQGITEFITEVKLIAKLQHRNLVKLLGYCFQGLEKLLIYEYMVNGSLDSFLFYQEKCKLLDWHQRFQIIIGIARGLLYLHQDSRLRIIHRDLKASNILLDEKLNPKISDFGMARVFGGDQTEGNTNRVVGTYGYMAPEYAVDGLFSIKSDVFSFGILMLEIICGNKNRAICHGNQTLNLVGYAWTLWKEQNALELIDSSIKESCVISEVVRCIHVSLLCLQQYPEDRPTMTLVIQMLGRETELVEPKEPAFYPRNILDEGNLGTNLNQRASNNELTITSLNGR